MADFALDTSAVLAYYYRESGWQRMTRYFAQAFRGSTRLAMHAANVGEVYYVAYRQGGETKAEQVFAHLHKLPIEILSRISNDLLKEAGRLKGTYPIAYGDAFAIATARHMHRARITCDRTEMEPLVRQGEVRCRWLR